MQYALSFARLYKVAVVTIKFVPFLRLFWVGNSENRYPRGFFHFLRKRSERRFWVNLFSIAPADTRPLFSLLFSYT